MNNLELESEPVKMPDQCAGIARRRLLRAGVAAAPVVLAVSGRSAMAAACPSPMSKPTQDSLDPQVTGNCIVSSHHPEVTALVGWSPEYWTPNSSGIGQTFPQIVAWPVAPFSQGTINGIPTPWNASSWTSYNGIPSNDPCWDTGTKFKDVFTSSTELLSFSRILLNGNSSSLNWYLCAAYMNALVMPGAYAMTPADVIELADLRRLVPGGPLLTDGQLIAFLKQTWV